MWPSLLQPGTQQVQAPTLQQEQNTLNRNHRPPDYFHNPKRRQPFLFSLWSIQAWRSLAQIDVTPLPYVGSSTTQSKSSSDKELIPVPTDQVVRARSGNQESGLNPQLLWWNRGTNEALDNTPSHVAGRCKIQSLAEAFRMLIIQ